MKKTDSYEKQHRKEKLLIEEKIGLLFDQESFRTLEGGKEEKAGSVVTGYGTIEGRRVYMYAHNSAVKGGTVGLQEGKRIRKLIEEAMRQRRPVVGIQDSGGARIQEGIAALAGYGEVLKAHAAAAGVIPQVMVVAGTCAGGAAYSPGLADFTFIVEETGYMFVTGPDVVEKSCGQKCTWEETGGAGLHGKLSGAAHFCSKNEKECFVRLKRLLIYLSDGMDEKRRRKIVRRRDGDHILPGMREIVPANGRKGYDVCAVIGRIVDRGKKGFCRKHCYRFWKNGRADDGHRGKSADEDGRGDRLQRGRKRGGICQVLQRLSYSGDYIYGYARIPPGSRAGAGGYGTPWRKVIVCIRGGGYGQADGDLKEGLWRRIYMHGQQGIGNGCRICLAGGGDRSDGSGVRHTHTS